MALLLRVSGMERCAGRLVRGPLACNCNSVACRLSALRCGASRGRSGGPAFYKTDSGCKAII